ncbi:hypothetical protein BZG36_01542 [Bifiguratus adelaidae]|uniref:Uncharacterized protein n=1 Tax=Bifiguratus adelaidae TaxID=1938954 RepID=A0A261Y4A6_9FUNG|nr:hypothetical protein BZG36_01542 [Bifiguratus adelaidae]
MRSHHFRRQGSWVQYLIAVILVGLLAPSINAQAVSQPAVTTTQGTQTPPAVATTDSTTNTATSAPPNTSTATAPSQTSTTVPSSTSTTTSATPTTTDISGCLTATDDSHDWFPQKLDYSKLVDADFNVTYFPRYKSVSNFRTGENMMLYCTETPLNISGVDFKVKVRVPVSNAAIRDSSVMGYFDLLGATSAVKYSNAITTSSSVTNLTSPCGANVQGFNGSAPSGADVIFSPQADPNNMIDLSLKFDDNMLPLQKATYVKFFSLFVNQENMADSVFDMVNSTYTCQKQAMNTANIAHRKNVTWMIYSSTDNTFNFQTGQYYKTLTEAAGANLTIFLTGTTAFTTDALRNMLVNNSVLIDMTQYPSSNNTISAWYGLTGYSAQGVINANNAQTQSAIQNGGLYINSPDAPPFMRNGELWRTDYTASSNGAQDWFNRAPSRPDLALMDLVAAQFPDYLGSSYTRTFLRNFTSSETSHTANSNGYCAPTSIESCIDNTNFVNTDSDFSTNAKLPAGTLSQPAKIGLIVGGSVLGACFIAAGFVALRTKLKNRASFSKLNEPGDDEFEMPGSARPWDAPPTGNY